MKSCKVSPRWPRGPAAAHAELRDPEPSTVPTSAWPPRHPLESMLLNRRRRAHGCTHR